MQIKHFSLAIVDESSQILEPQLIGLLSAQKDRRCQIDKFVLIGDHKQLPAVVQQPQEESAVTEPELNAIHLRDCRLSLFERMLVQFKTENGYDERFVYMLTKQGRMHRDIDQFPNQAFYGNKNVALTRARLNIVIIGNPVLLDMNFTYSQLMEFVRKKGGYYDVPMEDYCKGNFQAGSYTLHRICAGLPSI